MAAKDGKLTATISFPRLEVDLASMGDLGAAVAQAANAKVAELRETLHVRISDQLNAEIAYQTTQALEKAVRELLEEKDSDLHKIVAEAVTHKLQSLDIPAIIQARITSSLVSENFHHEISRWKSASMLQWQIEFDTRIEAAVQRRAEEVAARLTEPKGGS